MPVSQSSEPASSAAFRLGLCGGVLGRHHRRSVGDLARELPWDTLDPSVLAAGQREAAARRWTELAFNEHRSAIVMAQLVQALGQAQVPLDLHSLACRFPVQELAHAEICGRMAALFGDCGPVETATLATAFALSEGLTAQQRCHELVVRLCCVSETLSVAWLACWRDRVRQPLLRAVFSRLLRDEALHSRFGWLYLDWAAEDGAVDATEARRLVATAEKALRDLAPPPGADVDGPSWPDELVILPRAEYRELHRSVMRDVGARLAPLVHAGRALAGRPAREVG